MVHDPLKFLNQSMKLESINNNFIIATNGPEITIWNQYKPNSWGIYQTLDYQNLPILQTITNAKLRLHSEVTTSAQKIATKYLVFLHEGGVVSYWNQDTFIFVHSFTLNSQNAIKLIFESSYRFLASLNSEGSVEVWKVKGKEEKHWWDLQFKSVKDIQNNP